MNKEQLIVDTGEKIVDLYERVSEHYDIKECCYRFGKCSNPECGSRHISLLVRFKEPVLSNDKGELPTKFNEAYEDCSQYFEEKYFFADIDDDVKSMTGFFLIIDNENESIMEDAAKYAIALNPDIKSAVEA